MRTEIGFILAAFLGGMAVQDRAADDKVVWVDYGANPMANPAFMKDTGAAAAPGKEHKLMAKGVGSWDVDAKMWMGPAGPPMPSVGKSEHHTILGGRYMIQEYKSSFMGMSFEGMLIQGYSNLHKKNVSIWLDSMSTWPSISWGMRDEEGVVESKGTTYDVMTPGGRPTRSRVVEKEDGTFVLELYDSLPDGGDFKVMEMTYSRAK